MNSKQSNITDLPLISPDGDKLGLKEYIEALSSFIRRARTPMTIAIQGEWGCGKTSLMNAVACSCCQNGAALTQHIAASEEDLVRQRDEEHPYIGIWINTWQYSMLKSSADTQTAVIKGVIRELNAQMVHLKKTSAKVKETGRQLLNSFSCLALTAARIGVGAAGINPVALDELNEFLKSEQEGPESIRRQLQKAVRDYIDELNSGSSSGKIKGFIFFIDDLDRLDPPVAVQILSLLKNLFEVDMCIFVLAVDYDVVVEGLTSRFGVKTESNEREFRSFFDKIIQLCFRVPADTYEIRGLLSSLLADIDYGDDELRQDEDFLNLLVKFTEKSCGKNPRSIKRMINMLSLDQEIHRLNRTEFAIRDKNAFLKVLFAAVCLQTSYLRIYQELVKKKNLAEWIKKDALQLENIKTVEDLKQTVNNIKPDDFCIPDAGPKDLWINKKISDIQEILCSLFKILVLSKIPERNYDEVLPEKDRDCILKTSEDLKQVLQVCSFTSSEAGNDDEDDEDYDGWLDVEDTITQITDEYGGEKDSPDDDVIDDLKEFLSRTQDMCGEKNNLVIDGRNRIQFYATRRTNPVQIFNIEVQTNGFIVRVSGRGRGKSGSAFAVTNGGPMNLRGISSDAVYSFSDLDDSKLSELRQAYRDKTDRRRLCSWNNTRAETGSED
jgi:hypothetical protein